MYENYIFDLYGTLADIHTNENSVYLWRKLTELYASYGAFYEKGELRRAFFGRCRELEESAAEQCAEPDIAEAFLWCYTQKKASVSMETVKNTALFFRILSRKYICLYDGVTELLQTLKKSGKKIYLLSNAQGDFTRPELTLLGIEGYFDGILLSSEEGVRKPGAKFYELLLQRYALQADKSIMIGNDIRADILGARAVGLSTLYIHSNISPREDAAKMGSDFGADYCIWDGDFRRIKGMIT